MHGRATPRGAAAITICAICEAAAIRDTTASTICAVCEAGRHHNALLGLVPMAVAVLMPTYKAIGTDEKSGRFACIVPIVIYHYPCSLFILPFLYFPLFADCFVSLLLYRRLPIVSTVVLYYSLYLHYLLLIFCRSFFVRLYCLFTVYFLLLSFTAHFLLLSFTAHPFTSRFLILSFTSRHLMTVFYCLSFCRGSFTARFYLFNAIYCRYAKNRRTANEVYPKS